MPENGTSSSYDWAPEGFNVWLGADSPSGNFANEYGTWIFPMVHIVADPGGSLTLEGLQFASNFGGVPFLFVYGSSSSTSYSPFQQGIIHAPGGDQILLSGESPSTAVDELLVIGPGFFFDITCATIPGPPLCDPANPLTRAQQLALARGTTRSTYGGQTFDFSWNGVVSSGSFAPSVSAVPEPSGMIGVGVIALMALKRVARANTRRKCIEE